jgi:hypothetical protein
MRQSTRIKMSYVGPDARNVLDEAAQAGGATIDGAGLS